MYSAKLPIFIKKFSWTAVFCLASPSLFAASLTVNVAGDANVATGGTITGTSGDLRGVLNYINQNPGSHTVTFSLPGAGDNVITLNAMLPILNLNAANTVSMDGANSGTPIVIDGNTNIYRGLFARQGTITLQNLTIQNVGATGGAGGTSPGGAGGGGMGAGGALFVDQAAVTVSNVAFNNATASGGAGGVSSVGDYNAGGGGGGGMGGNGGNSGPISIQTFQPGAGGGGGLGGVGGIGGASSGAGGGGGINCGTNFTGTGGNGPLSSDTSTGFPGAQGGGIGGSSGGASANCSSTAVLGGADGGGGAGGSDNGCAGATAAGGGGVGGSAAVGLTPGVGGYGGGGGGGESATIPGAIGGFGGGGGGGMQSTGAGGAGGFGGGGGGSGSFATNSTGGIGGFGGGGGGSYSPGFAQSAGGVGGGAGQVGGGGGAGFGGAIFVNSGGSLAQVGTFTSGANSTIGGAAGTNATQGWNAGNHAFIVTGSSITYDPNGGTITISSTIADDSAASFVGAPTGVTAGTGAGGALIVGSAASSAGVLNLTAANTYSGGTTFTKGTLNVGNNTALGTGPLTFSTISGNILQPSTGSLNLNNHIALNVPGVFNTNGNSFTLSGNISGFDSLTKQGAETLILSGTLNNYSGGTIVNGGTLQVNSAGSIPATEPINLAGSGTKLDISFATGTVTIGDLTGVATSSVTLGSSTLAFGTGTPTVTYPGNISGTLGSLIKQGGGKVILSGTNTYTGTTTVSNGILQINSTASIPLGTNLNTSAAGAELDLSTAGGAITLGDISGAAGSSLSYGANSLTFGTNTISTTYAGNISGSASLTKQGSGTVIFSGTNNYTGDTNISAGTLQINSSLSFPQKNLNLTAAGAQFNINGAGIIVADLIGVAGSSVVMGSHSLTLGTATPTVTFAGDISATTGSLTKQGTGTVIFSGTNSYNGTTINAGTLQINSVGSIPSGKNINITASGAQLDLSSAGGTVTIGDLSGVAGSSVTLGANNLIFGTSSFIISYSGNISGTSAALTKQGSGTAILAGTSTYSGGTTVSAGTLRINSTASIPSGGNVNTSASGAKLDLSTAGGAITLGDLSGVSGSSVTLGTNNLTFGTATASTTYAGNITGTSSSLTKQGSGIAILSGTNSYTGGTVINAGTLQINATASLPSGKNINTSASGAKLDISSAGGGVTIGDLTGVAGSLVALGNNTLTLGTTTPSVSYGGNISGVSGSVTKQGSGTVVLSGTNTYTGTTTVSAGVLQINSTASIPSAAAVNISSSGAQLDLSSAGGSVTIGNLVGVSGGSVTLGSNSLTFGTATPTSTFAGNITGTSSSLTKQGSGTAILSGTNTYTGETTVSAGTLQINSLASIPSGGNVNTSASGAQLDLSSAGGAVTLGDLSGVSGSSTTLGSNNLAFGTTTSSSTYAGNITGTTASLTKQGSGTVILSGTNSYTGGTVVSAGTLQISATASLPSGGNINTSASGAQLDLSSAGGGVSIGDLTGVAGSSVSLGSNSLAFGTATPTVTYVGNISGTLGSIIKQGSGTAILSGTNTYSGPTTVSAGILQINSVSSLPSGTSVNTASSGAQLNLASAGGAIVIGDLSGAAGSSVSLGTNALTLGTSNSTTFAGDISGSSTLTKQGSGTWTLSGANTFNGIVNVNAGTMNVNGSFPAASTVNVASGATLSGSGTLGSVVSSGTVSPGNSIGTLNVIDFTFLTGSNFILEVSNTASDQIIASGTVTIDPGTTISLTGVGLSSPLPSYTIITSGNPLVGSGNFTLINSLPRFNFSLGYDVNHVFLLLDTVNPVNPFTATGNAAGVANAFNTLLTTNPNAPGLSDVLAVLELQTQSQWQDSFNQMQPANIDGIAFAEENVAERIRQGFSTRLFQQRVEACPTQDPCRIWIVPFIEHVHQRGHKSLDGYKENFRGFSTGFDYQFEKHWAITTGFSLVDSDVSIVNGKAGGNFQTYAGTFGAIWAGSHFFVDGLLSYLYSDVDVKRRMHFSATGANSVRYKARHDQNSNQFLGHFGAGYDFKIKAGEHSTVNIYPFVDVDYLFLSQNGYTEHGAQALDLKVYRKRYDLLRPEGGIGIGYAGCFHESNVNFDVTTSYIREQRFLGKKTKARFEEGPKKFTVRGLNPRNNLLGVGARVTYAMPRDTNATLSIGYHGEFGANFVENAADMELRFSF